ncbi:DUF1353 domain-containing protein [uncultured Sphingomonas sp.]|uniref:DUF1353 domain-containing protein n=1 Tax=uncultured Sphingomonas sp. TaxID=158754 RepID=UPI002591B24F|nr:DUF1353 domain-containing protein [uncultured Sphingomonas sp.]
MRFARVALPLGLAVVALQAQAQEAARYIGKPVVDLDGGIDGRHVRLVQPFTFVDATGLRWDVPAGTMVDGASIPQPFWSLIGGPFEGKYRDASIIHDRYCVTKDRPWQKVHRMFYEAMLVSGVEPMKAKLMYYAVYRFGPRWEQRTVLVPTHGFDGTEKMKPAKVPVDLPSPIYNADEVRRSLERIQKENPSVEQIEQIASQP